MECKIKERNDLETRRKVNKESISFVEETINQMNISDRYKDDLLVFIVCYTWIGRYTR